MKASLKHLGFGSLRASMSKTFKNIPDYRQEEKVDYTIHDALMSGFAMMYFQDPSFLQFQKRLEEQHSRSNLTTIFAVENIPKPTQHKAIIDEIDPIYFNSIFKEYLRCLQRGKHLEQYQFIPNFYLCSIDGSGYFSSNEIHCPACLKKEHKKGQITYSHQILQGALMHPDQRQVLPLMPEEIRNTDGSEKQDCGAPRGVYITGGESPHRKSGTRHTLNRVLGLWR